MWFFRKEKGQWYTIISKNKEIIIKSKQQQKVNQKLWESN